MDVVFTLLHAGQSFYLCLQCFVVRVNPGTNIYISKCIYIHSSAWLNLEPYLSLHGCIYIHIEAYIDVSISIPVRAQIYILMKACMDLSISIPERAWIYIHIEAHMDVSIYKIIHTRMWFNLFPFLSADGCTGIPPNWNAKIPSFLCNKQTCSNLENVNLLSHQQWYICII